MKQCQLCCNICVPAQRSLFSFAHILSFFFFFQTTSGTHTHFFLLQATLANIKFHYFFIINFLYFIVANLVFSLSFFITVKYTFFCCC